MDWAPTPALTRRGAEICSTENPEDPKYAAAKSREVCRTDYIDFYVSKFRRALRLHHARSQAAGFEIIRAEQRSARRCVGFVRIVCNLPVWRVRATAVFQ